MNIGLFGDSFAETNTGFGCYKLHWSNLIAEKLNANITNFGLAGSSVYYSYKNFKNNFQNFDLNIFCVTDPNRYIRHIQLKSQTICLPSISALDYYDESEYVFPNKKHLYGWYISSDNEYNDEMTTLMINEVLKLDNNVIIIPCFAHSLPDGILQSLGLRKEMNLAGLQIFQLQHMKNISLYELFAEYVENVNYISGHLVPEIHAHFAKLLLDRITTKKWNWHLPVNFECKYKFTELYTKR